MTERWLERVLRPVEWLSAAALGALTALVFVSITLRFFFNAPIRDSFDLSRMFLGIAIFWGIAAACGRDEYIRADLLWDKLGKRARAWVDFFGRLAILLFVALLIWKLFDKVADTRRVGEVTTELRVALWPFFAIAWLATVLTAVAVVARFAAVIRLFRAGRDVGAIATSSSNAQ